MCKNGIGVRQQHMHTLLLCITGKSANQKGNKFFIVLPCNMYTTSFITLFYCAMQTAQSGLGCQMGGTEIKRTNKQTNSLIGFACCIWICLYYCKDRFQLPLLTRVDTFCCSSLIYPSPLFVSIWPLKRFGDCRSCCSSTMGNEGVFDALTSTVMFFTFAAKCYKISHLK